MKRFKNWIHGSLWAVIFGLGLYVLVKGVSIAGGGKNLTRKTAQLYAPVFTLAPVKGTENQSWLSLLTKEVVPLLTYWESKESYFLSEEPQLTVREETEKNPESEKTQETQKSSEVQNTQDQMPQKAEAESMEETEKTVIQKAVKKKKRKKNKKAQTEETKEVGYRANLCLAGGFYYRMGRWIGEPYIKNAVNKAESLCFPAELISILAEYYGEEQLPSSPESALVHMVDAVVIRLEAMEQNVGQSVWNRDIVIYQTVNDFSSSEIYDHSGMSMNQFLKIREFLAKEELLR